MRELIDSRSKSSSVLTISLRFTLELADTPVELVELGQQSVIVFLQRVVQLKKALVLAICLGLLLSPVLLTLSEFLNCLIALACQSVYLGVQLFNVDVELLNQFVLLAGLGGFRPAWLDNWLSTHPIPRWLLHRLHCNGGPLPEDNLGLLDVRVSVLLRSVPRDKLSGVKSRNLRQGKSDCILVVFEIAHGVGAMPGLEDDFPKIRVLLHTLQVV